MHAEEAISRTRKVRGMRVHVYGSQAPAIVDQDVFQLVSTYSWHLQHSDGYRYVVTNTPTQDRREFGQSETVSLSEMVLGRISTSSERIAFLNGDPLDCRVENLAVLTTTQCAGLAKLSSVNKSGFKGVCWSKACKKWVASIGAGKTKRTLGLFVEKENAARAYDAAALKYYGPTARTNASMGLFEESKNDTLAQ